MTLVAAVVLLPFRVAWFFLRPVAAMAVGLASVAAFLVLFAVLVAHLLR